jgi:hypothetical protein
MSYGSPGMYVSGAPTSGIPPVPFQQPTNLFRYGEQSIWSTQFFDASAAALDVASQSFWLFSTPIGQTGQGFTPMSISETSLKEGGRIPAGVSFDVFGISCHIYAGDDAAMPDTNFGTATDDATKIGNLLNVQNNGVLSWDFLQTTVEISPVHMIGAGGGAFGAVVVDGNAAATFAGNMQNGAGTVWFYRKHAVALPGQSTFSLLLRFGNYAAPIANNSTLAVKVSLLGYYKSVIEVG